MRHGNLFAVRHIETVLGFVPVSSPTGPLPPSSSITSDVLWSSCMTQPYSTKFGNARAEVVPESFLGKNIWSSPHCSAMASSEKPDLDTARRLRILRVYANCGDSQTRFAQRYGFTVKQWNNFERGHPLSKEAAIQLVRKFQGLTLDWLHLGRPDGLPGTLRRELEEAGKTVILEESPSARRSGR